MSFEFTAELRKDSGKGASRRLRHADKVPAIIYGGEAAPVSIELAHDALLHAQENAEFYSEELTITVDGKAEKVKVQDIQRHAFKPKLIHVDFKRA